MIPEATLVDETGINLEDCPLVTCRVGAADSENSCSLETFTGGTFATLDTILEFGRTGNGLIGCFDSFDSFDSFAAPRDCVSFDRYRGRKPRDEVAVVARFTDAVG